MTTTPPLNRTLFAFASAILLASCSTTPAEQKAETEQKLEKIEDKMTDASALPTLAAWENERTAILNELRICATTSIEAHRHQRKVGRYQIEAQRTQRPRNLEDRTRP
ncbi:MAG: hypothetical protein IPK99_17305 [Flavobacteriales bacterium]|nr:hypothetical protein [Flavobacteriales bacterium]